ncbi:MAG: DUF2293 domain-containing protein [Planctomycetota bacterium]|nr:DUF2293 domain-containing protein [Planctomycetota bacterium]
MANECKAVRPSDRERIVLDESGKALSVPSDWILVPPGDPALTRRIKAGGPSWQMQEKKGRRTFSKGLWAEGQRVAEIQANLVVEREDPAYAKRRASDKARREKQQVCYAAEFESEVRRFLDFHLKFDDLEKRLAQAVSAHAVPVGSGTVARTKRIPVAQRAEAAVIAWMRHATTAYDSLVIPRIKGRRREVRRALAERSRELLESYRRGDEPSAKCPLNRALT